MLTLNKQQVEAIGDHVFSHKMRLILNEAFSDSTEVAAAELEEIISELTEQAEQYQLTLETEVAPFVVCAWLYGVPFDSDFSAVREVLEDTELSGADKAEFLWQFAEVGMEILEEDEQEF